MTAAILTHLPLAAGSAVLASASRAALWTFSHYMRAPLANTAIVALVGSGTLAASNALYFQQEHPAPLFGSVESSAGPDSVDMPEVVPKPAARVPRLQRIAPLPTIEATGTPERDRDAVIGNAEVFELQRKLVLMGLFDGKVDGYYGPQTAGAIRRFEERMGMRQTGELTPAIIEAVREAPAFSTEPRPGVVQPQAALSPAPAPTTIESVIGTISAADLGANDVPLPGPKPLPASVQPQDAPIITGSASRERRVLRRELPETPQEAFNIAVDTAGEAIETIIEGVQAVTMYRRPSRPPAAEWRQAPDTSEQPTWRQVGQAEATVAAPGTSPQAPERLAMLANDRQPTANEAPQVTAAPAVMVEEPGEVPILDTDAKPEDLMPPFSVTDPVVVARVQRGLASLGFLHGPVDGIAGEATAKAIRNFEVYFNYDVTGRITPELLDLLEHNGASI